MFVTKRRLRVTLTEIEPRKNEPPMEAKNE